MKDQDGSGALRGESYYRQCEQTSTHWSQAEEWSDERGMAWTELAPVRERLNAKTTGDVSEGWVEYTLRTHLKDLLPLERCLSLCCGRGGLERNLASKGAFLECDGVDIAEGSIDRARERARAEGYHSIHYRVQDVNTIEIPEDRYDVVWSSAAVHHVENLEHVFAEVRKGLKAEGLFVLNEYVGPRRFQFSARQKEVIQGCFLLLPEQYRRPTKKALADEVARNPLNMGWGWTIRRIQDKVREGTLLATVQRRIQGILQLYFQGQVSPSSKAFPSTSDVIAVDPSEAIRSDEILPLLHSHFEVIDYKPLGGSILQFLLHGIAGNFAVDDPQAMAWLDTLFEIEDFLLNLNELNTDFAYIVGKPMK